jgi:hypothetical protein
LKGYFWRGFGIAVGVELFSFRWKSSRDARILYFVFYNLGLGISSKVYKILGMQVRHVTSIIRFIHGVELEDDMSDWIFPISQNHPYMLFQGSRALGELRADKKDPYLSII